MRKNRQQQTPLMNIGSSSLLIVFLVLCLVTFAILSLVSARRDVGFSQQLASRRTQYYEANSQAEQIKGQIDKILAQAYESDDYEAETEKLIAGQDWDGIEVALQQDGDQTSITYQVPCSDSQVIDVVLSLAGPDGDGTRFTIDKWQVEQTTEYNDEQKINLMPIED